MNIPKKHQDHWMEPWSFTQKRSELEKYCESCGEDIPWHNISCKMLRVAFRTRKKKCQFCAEEHEPGADMFVHTTAKHIDELKEAYPGMKLGPGPRPLTSRRKQGL